MSSYSQFLPSYTIGDSAYDSVAEICLPYGKKAVVIGGRRSMEAIKELLTNAVSGAGLEIIGFVQFGGEASFEDGDELIANPLVKSADMIFSAGGGKATDCCKYVSFKLKKPFFAFPTIAATCAATSTVAVMYNADGTFKECCYFDGRPARHVFINTKVIASAPDVYLWAGIGDTMAKHFETSIAARNKELKHGDTFGVSAGEQCYKPLILYGEKALNDCKNNRASFELEQICLCNIVTTGMVSNFVSEIINTNIAHGLFNGFTVLPQIEKRHLHGEVVAYAVLVMLMYDGQAEKAKELIEFYKKINLPTKLSDIEVTFDELEPVLTKTINGEDVKSAPYPVTYEKLYQAMLDVDNLNK